MAAWEEHVLARRRTDQPEPLVRATPSPESFALCRAFGHSWRHRQPQRDVNSTLIIQLSQCPECTTLRTRYVTRSGTVRPARYEHPDGYATHGDDRKTLPEWRLVIVATLFEDEPKKVRKSA